jgi:hypothetical protein
MVCNWAGVRSRDEDCPGLTREGVRLSFALWSPIRVDFSQYVVYNPCVVPHSLKSALTELLEGNVTRMRLRQGTKRIGVGEYACATQTARR